MYSPRGLIAKVLVLALLVGAGSYLSTVRPSADVFTTQTGSYTFSSTAEAEKSTFWDRCDSRVIPSEYQPYMQSSSGLSARLSSDTLDMSDGQANNLTIDIQIPTSFEKVGTVGIAFPSFWDAKTIRQPTAADTSGVAFTGGTVAPFVQSFSPAEVAADKSDIHRQKMGIFFRKGANLPLYLPESLLPKTLHEDLNATFPKDFISGTLDWFAGYDSLNRSIDIRPGQTTELFLPPGSYQVKLQIPDTEFGKGSVGGKHFVMVYAQGYQQEYPPNGTSYTQKPYLGAQILPIRVVGAPQITLDDWADWNVNAQGIYWGPGFFPSDAKERIRGATVNLSVTGDAELVDAPTSFPEESYRFGPVTPEVKPIGQGKSFTLSAKVTNGCGTVETSKAYTFKRSGESVLTSSTPTTTPSTATTPPSASPTATPTAAIIPSVTLTADPAEITAGQATMLKWQATNASAVVESNFDTKDLSGEKQVSPTETTTYSLVVQGTDTTARAEAKVTVKPAPVETVQTTSAPAATTQAPAPPSATATPTPSASATTQKTKKATPKATPAAPTPPPATETTSPPIDRSATISDTVQFVKVAGSATDLGQAVQIPQGTPLQVGVIQGAAAPGETVTITVYSEPKIYTVTADATGHWSLEIPTAELEAGEHRIEYETSSKPKTELMKFTVQATAEPTPTSAANTPLPTATDLVTSAVADPILESGSFLEALLGSMPWWGWIVVALILAILIYLFLHSRKLAAHNLHEPDDLTSQQ